MQLFAQAHAPKSFILRLLPQMVAKGSAQQAPATLQVAPDAASGDVTGKSQVQQKRQGHQVFRVLGFTNVHAKGTNTLGKHVLSEQGEIKGAHARVAYAPKHAVHAPSQISSAKHARHARKEAVEDTFDFTPLDEEPRALSTLDADSPDARFAGPETPEPEAPEPEPLDLGPIDVEPLESTSVKSSASDGASAGAADAKEPAANASVARSTALMSIATLGSRATGLVRTWAMAFVLGNSFLTSSYQVANNMPNTIYELVVGGILGAAFIPIFLLQKEQKGEKGANDFACNVLNLFLIILSLLTLAAAIFAPQVIWTQTFAEGSSQEVIDQAVRFFRIFAIQILFYGIGGVVTGMLNANRVYFLPSLAPALNNIIVIASFFAYIPLSNINVDLALNVLAIGTSLGVVVQFVIQIPALVRGGFRYRWFIDLHDPALLEAVKIALPTFLYIVGTMISFSCRNAFSLQAGDNGPSTLIYAWTWYQLPHGVLAVSLSRALFTEMSDASAKNDTASLKYHVSSGISGTLLLMIPMAFLLGALSTPLMQLFRAGAFSMDDVRFVASILAMWAISLPFYSVSMFIYNVYASIRKFSVFAAISCGLVVVQVALYAVLCGTDELGLYGVPLADLAYYGLLCIIGMLVLRKYVGSGIKYGHMLFLAVRACIASALGAGAAYLLLGVLSSALSGMGSGMLAGLIQLCLCGMVGLVVTFGLCLAFRIPEMRTITRRFKR